jgi:ATP-dependent DNA ligase
MYEEKIFDTLYGLDKSNKIKEWNIKVVNMINNSIIIYTYGLLGGKKTECKITLTEGKNKGKKNETNHYTQAILDAKSKWNKKKDIDGYITVLDEIKKKVESGNYNIEVKKPMLAQEFKKHENKVVYPCFIQPKLDGYRCIYDNNLKISLTRTGKQFKIIEKTDLFKEMQKINYCLDGELYVHDEDFKFENYGVLRKTKELNDKEKKILNKIEYHIYDIVDENKTYKDRQIIIDEIFKNNSFVKIKKVETVECKNKDDIVKYHKIFTNDYFEGSIIRNANGIYKCKYRSFDLLKYKDFDDGEFEIIDYTFEKDVSGKDKKMIVWICKTANNKSFNVQSKGTKEIRAKLYENAKKYIGKKLWVQYFGLTNEGIPRFPKTMRDGENSFREEIN